MTKTRRGLLSPSLLILALGCVACEGSSPSTTAGAAGSTTQGDGVAGSGNMGAEQAQLLEGTPTVAWDYTGIVGTGQSLAVGAEAGNITAAARTQPFNNLKLSLGALTVPPLDEAASQSAELSLVPLVEPIRATANGYPRAYPQNLYGESPHTAMSAQLTQLATAVGGLDELVTVHTVVGESGQGMNIINKAAVETVDGSNTTGRAYAASLFEARAIARLAQADSKTYGVGAIFLTHGETDAGNSNYDNDMLQLWTDYNADLKAITGQTEAIPLFTSQQHGIFQYALGDAPTRMHTSTRLQWTAALDNPDEIVCVGPKYQYPYSPDYLHLTPLGYELMGEKYAEAYYRHVLLGRPWKPLQPLANTVSREGAVITVDFEVPVPPLAWDDALPTPHENDLTEWAPGRGFEVRSGATRLAITGVQFVDEDTVQITCAEPIPDGSTLGYAATSDGQAVSGFAPRLGQLKDSDPFVGQFTGTAQANYAVAFELPIP